MPEPNPIDPEAEQSNRKPPPPESAIRIGEGAPGGDSGLLVTLGKIAGIGGISLGVIFLLFSNFIQQKFLPQLEPDQGYNLLLLFMLFTFGMASAGLAVWASQIRTGKRFVILLLSFALAMSVLGAYLIQEGKEKPDKTVGFQAASGDISVPKNGDLVQKDFDASGTAHIGKDVYLWLAVELNGRIWPKEGRISVGEKGGWKQSVSEEGSPHKFVLSLWAVDSNANNKLAGWLEHCVTTNDCPGWPPLSGMKRLDRIRDLHLVETTK